MRVVVEIGAHNGNDTDQLSRQGDTVVFSFEPEPGQFKALQDRFPERHNLHLLPFAVDLEDGHKTFHVSHNNGGINSLYQLHPNLMNTALRQYGCFREGWGHSVGVWTIRLDTFMYLYNVPQIDFLWCDAQGNDLRCLQSAGSRIGDIKEGRCEVTYKVPIYEGVDNTYDTVNGWLLSEGFKTEIEFTHPNDSEIDIHFWR